MKLPNSLRRRLLNLLLKRVEGRTPDLVINDGYLFRWHLYRNKKVGCVYLHLIAGDDDDRALHDHPWWNVSIILSGSYYEHLPGGYAIKREPGTVTFRRPESLHRLELCYPGDVVWSLFVTGPVVRDWGFQTDRGWVSHTDFLSLEESRI